MNESDYPNPSGIIPVEYKVLVKLDEVAEKTGNIFIPQQAREREQMAETRATLIAVGGNAFSDWADPLPKPGDRIIVSRYSGQAPKAGETDTYRLCQDKDIAAILTA